MENGLQARDLLFYRHFGTECPHCGMCAHELHDPFLTTFGSQTFAWLDLNGMVAFHCPSTDRLIFRNQTS